MWGQSMKRICVCVSVLTRISVYVCVCVGALFIDV